MPRNVFNREEPFTLQELTKGVENTASFRRRKVSFSIMLSCHVENTSHEMEVSELHAGAVGSWAVFSWVVPM